MGKASGRPFRYLCSERVKNRFEAMIFLPKITLDRASGGPFHSLCLERVKCRFEAKNRCPKGIWAEPSADLSFILFGKGQIPI